MNNKIPISILSEQDLDLIYQISKEKAERVRKQTEHIYNRIIEDKEKVFLERYDNWLLNGKKLKFIGIETKKKLTYQKKLWLAGWKIRDPYFLWNFRAIYPIIKRDFFDKGVTTTMVRINYCRKAMNDAFKVNYGTALVEFLRVFNGEGEEYIKELNKANIKDKLYNEQKNYNPNWSGLPNSIVSDLLGAMRTMMK